MANGEVKVKPARPKRRFVGIDVTESVDTVVFGHMWASIFTWQNLLSELDLDPADASKRARIDRAHPKMPIRFAGRKHGGNVFASTVLMPMGPEGKTLPPLTTADADNFMAFMQKFILRPSADKASSSLNDSGTGVVADLVYISSHGYRTGIAVADDLDTELFNAPRAANDLTPFSFPGWLILCNCGNLHPDSHNSWQILMQGPTPLRGILGFTTSCPPPAGSSDFIGIFIELLRKKTLISAWGEAVTTKWSSDTWGALCHEEAAKDKVPNWTADKLPPVSPSSPILFFNDANPKGLSLQIIPDPYPAFWIKSGRKITPANAGIRGNPLVVGDTAVIKIEPQPPAVTFIDKTPIAVTLIFIRPDYKQVIDVTQLFSVTGQSGIDSLTTDDLNPENTPGPDSYKFLVSGTPTAITLKLECVDFSKLKDNGYFYLRINIAGTVTEFRNSVIHVLKKPRH